MKTNSIIIACLAITISSVPLFYLNRSHFKYNLIYNFLDNPQNKANSKDTIRVNVLNKKAFDLRLTDPEKTIVIADSALIIAKNINYLSGTGEALRVKGVGYSYLNNIEFAVKNYILALDYFERTRDKTRKARVYNNLGKLYKEIDSEKSLFYLNKALFIAEKFGDTELTGGLYFNLSEIYRKRGHFKKSLYLIEQSNTIFRKLQDTTLMIMHLQNSGVIYYELKKFSEAEKRLKDAIAQASKRKLYKILVGSNLTLIDIYLEQKKYHKVQKRIKDGLKYANLIKDTSSINYLNYKDFEVNDKLKNYSKAIDKLKKVYTSDSLQLSKYQSDNIEKTSTHYFHIQKLQESELTIAKQRYNETIYWWILTSIFTLILLAIIIGIAIRYYIKKKLEKEKIEIKSKINILEQKALQASMNPHFLYNILSTIQYFISQDNNQTANTILSKFAKLMRKHLEICMKSTISLNEEIQYLDLYLSLEKIRFTRKLEYYINFSPEVSEDEILIPSMLIQPFVENAIWHGLMPKEDGGYIKIDIAINDNILTINIIDNGIGILNSLNNKKSVHISRGLELIQERISLMNQLSDRKITISQDQMGESGTQVIITIEL